MNEAGALILKATDSKATLAEKHAAFEELVRIFQDMAYACAYAVLRDFCLAEDAAQEAFITAWQKLAQLQQPEAFPGWFKRIVVTECNRLTRRKQLRTTSLEHELSLPPAHAEPQLGLEKNELANAVRDAIENLPENERLVVVLFYIREHSQSIITAFLEVPKTTVAKRLYTARARLSRMIIKGLKNDLATHRPSRDKNFAERVAAGLYDEYVGQYRFETRPDLIVNIKREGAQLLSEAAGQRNDLFGSAEAKGKLLVKEFDGMGKFVRNDRGEISHFVYFEFGQEMGRAKKIV